VRYATARDFALSLPETTEEPHFEKSSFRVRGKIFCTVPEGQRHLHLQVDPAERRALIEGNPAAYEEVVWGARVVDDHVRVVLAHADRAEVCELLEDAWRCKAPKRVVQAYDADR
jgi:hypothetical protein